MADYNNNYLYTFEERGLDNLRRGVADLEKTLDNLEGKSGGYASGLNAIGREITGIGTRARAAADNVHRLERALRSLNNIASINLGTTGIPQGSIPGVGQSVSATAGAYVRPAVDPRLNIPAPLAGNVFPVLTPFNRQTAIYPSAGQFSTLAPLQGSQAGASAIAAQAAAANYLTPAQQIRARAVGRPLTSAPSGVVNPQIFSGFNFGLNAPAVPQGQTASIQAAGNAARTAGGQMDYFARTVRNVAVGFVAWQAMDLVISQLTKYLEVQRQVNDALADYRVATGSSPVEAQRFIETSFSSSLTAGIPVLDAAATLSQTRRVGADDAIAGLAGQLQRVSGLDALGSSRELISLQRQFPGMPVERILDTLIGAYQRSTFGGFNEIFDVLDVAGPTSRQLRTDLGGFVGLAAGATTVTSLSPNQVELGVRRIAGEYSDETSGFRRGLRDVGVDAIDQTTGSLRDFVDVFEELAAGAASGAISTDEIERLASTIPNVMGTAFGEMFTAMIEGSENVQAAVDSARSSQDEWASAFAIKMDTVSGAVGQLSTAWSIFLAVLDSSDTIKLLLNQATGAVLNAIPVSALPEGVSRGEAFRAMAAAIGEEEAVKLRQDYRDQGGYIDLGIGAIKGLSTRDIYADLPGEGQTGAEKIRRFLINQFGPTEGANFYADFVKNLSTGPSDEDVVAAQRLRGLPSASLSPGSPIQSIVDGTYKPRGLQYPPVPTGRSLTLPEGASRQQFDFLYKVEADKFEQKFGEGSLEIETSVLRVNGQLQLFEGNTDIATIALGQLADAASLASQQIVTLPENRTLEEFLAEAEAATATLEAQGFKVGPDQQGYFQDRYGNFVGTGTFNQAGAQSVTQNASQQMADARRAQAEAKKIEDEQTRYLKDIRDGIDDFGSKLLSPTAVTAVDIYRSNNPNALRGYEDKFDEPIRRIRSDIGRRLQSKPLEFPDELARAQSLGFFPAGIKDVTGDPATMRALLEGQLSEYEEAFYGGQLPLDQYDWATAVADYGKEQQAEKNRKAFNDRLVAELEAAADRGEIDTIVPEKVRLKYEGSEFANFLFGGKTSGEIGKELAPYGEEIQKQLGIGFGDASSEYDYVGNVIDTIKDQVNVKENQQALYQSGALVGKQVVGGISDAVKTNLLASIIAGLIQQFTNNDPVD